MMGPGARYRRLQVIVNDKGIANYIPVFPTLSVWSLEPIEKMYGDVCGISENRNLLGTESYLSLYARNLYTSLRMYIFRYIYIYTNYIYIHCICVCTNLPMCICIYIVCMWINIHTVIYIYIHTHARVLVKPAGNTRTHTQTCTRSKFCDEIYRICWSIDRRNSRRQTSDNMDRWKAEMGRVREEKIRREKS